MDRNYIRQFIHQTPFTPFLLIMDSGESYLVEHPDYILLAPKTALVYRKEHDQVAHLTLSKIASLEYAEAASHPRRKRKKR